jgi:hypothetical protein
MSDPHKAETAFRRTALVVAYAVFAVGTAALLVENDFWLLRKFVADFPGWRSLITIAVFGAIAMLIPKAVTWMASWLTAPRK